MSELAKDVYDAGIRCPLCQGRLVHRTGKYGPFWGCSDFPECKGSRSEFSVNSDLWGDIRPEIEDYGVLT